jgi:hypothetical protein
MLEDIMTSVLAIVITIAPFALLLWHEERSEERKREKLKKFINCVKYRIDREKDKY